MGDPFWLSLTNIVLGIVAGVCFLAVVSAVVYEIASRIKRRVTLSAELDRDMRRLVGTTGAGGRTKCHNRSANGKAEHQ